MKLTDVMKRKVGSLDKRIISSEQPDSLSWMRKWMESFTDDK